MSNARPMVIARFEFKPEDAAYFIEKGGKNRNIIELAFESPESLVKTMKELEDALIDVTALIGDRIITLSGFKV